MQIRMIERATDVIGGSQGYLGLPIRRELMNCTVNGNGTPCALSAWEPMPAELERLNAGASVIVRLLVTTRHPPIMVFAGDRPDQAPPDPDGSDMAFELAMQWLHADGAKITKAQLAAALRLLLTASGG